MIMPIEAHHGILMRDPSFSGVCLVMLYPGYETLQGAFSRRVLPSDDTAEEWRGKMKDLMEVTSIGPSAALLQWDMNGRKPSNA